MRNISEALFSLAGRGRPAAPERAQSSPVLAIVRLAESRRAWFITGVERTAESCYALGYEPGGIHSAARWFRVSVDFFDVAARASADRAVVEVLPTPVPLALIEDVSI